jgi:uncharacterized protein (TIGR03435 family)
VNRFIAALSIAAAFASCPRVIWAQAPKAAFEVASVKPSNPDSGNPMASIPMVMPPVGGRFTATSVPLRILVRMAYEVQDFQIVGGPSWQLTSKFDIHAKAEDGFAGSTKEMLPLLKALLADRFKLKVHMEKRDMPISTLVVSRSDGKLGPDLKASTSNCPDPAVQAQKQAEAIANGGAAALVAQMMGDAPCMVAPIMPTGGGMTGFGIRANGQPLSQLTQLLTQATGRIVEDKTGLTGLYDWRLTFDPQVLMAMVGQLGLAIPPGALPQSDSPSLLTALQEQLGLKLNSARGPVDVLVIDSAEPPTVD